MKIERKRFVVMRKNRTEIWGGCAKNFYWRSIDDVGEFAIKTYRSEKQARTCSAWDRDFEVVPILETIVSIDGPTEKEGEKKMTCKECIHYEMCGKGVDGSMDRDQLFFESRCPRVEFDCPNYKPKSRFVEVPCEVGQTVWVIEPYEVWDGSEWSKILTEEKITKMCLIGSYQTRISIEDFGERVFLSREEAEKALAERSK